MPPPPPPKQEGCETRELCTAVCWQAVLSPACVWVLPRGARLIQWNSPCYLFKKPIWPTRHICMLHSASTNVEMIFLEIWHYRPQTPSRACSACAVPFSCDCVSGGMSREVPSDEEGDNIGDPASGEYLPRAPHREIQIRSVNLSVFSLSTNKAHVAFNVFPPSPRPSLPKHTRGW